MEEQLLEALGPEYETVTPMLRGGNCMNQMRIFVYIRTESLRAHLEHVYAAPSPRTPPGCVPCLTGARGERQWVFSYWPIKFWTTIHRFNISTALRGQAFVLPKDHAGPEGQLV